MKNYYTLHLEMKSISLLIIYFNKWEGFFSKSKMRDIISLYKERKISSEVMCSEVLSLIFPRSSKKFLMENHRELIFFFFHISTHSLFFTERELQIFTHTNKEISLLERWETSSVRKISPSFSFTKGEIGMMKFFFTKLLGKKLMEESILVSRRNKNDQKYISFEYGKLKINNDRKN